MSAFILTFSFYEEDRKMEEKENLSLLVHNFLDSIRAKEIPESRIKEFLDFVNKLKDI